MSIKVLLILSILAVIKSSQSDSVESKVSSDLTTQISSEIGDTAQNALQREWDFASFANRSCHNGIC